MTKEVERNSMNYASLEDLHIDEVEKNDSRWKFWQKRRYVLVFFAFFGFFISSMLRVNMSMAIVAMSSNTSQTKAEFEWDSKLQGYILSSYFYGSISTMFLGGWLSTRIGGKKVFGIGIGGVAIVTLIIPPLVRFSAYYLIALRAIGGFFQGLTLACMHSIWSKWAPPLERSKLTSTAIAGNPTGVVFTMFTSGIIAEQFGWSYIFYSHGVIGITFFVLWYYHVRDDPADDPKISYAELKYIKTSLGVTDRRQKKISHPWKAIFTSPPVWAIIIAHFSRSWGNWTIQTQLPKYLSSVLHFKLAKIGFLSALPYLLFSIILPFSGYLADYLRTKEIVTTTQVRKIFTCSGLISQMVCMILASFCENSTIIVLCITTNVALTGISTPGFCINHLDIAPQHASVLLGISSTAGILPGILSPILTGYIVQDGTAAQWRTVFIVASVIYLVGAIMYGLLGSGEKQKWAEETEVVDLNEEINSSVKLSTK